MLCWTWFIRIVLYGILILVSVSESSESAAEGEHPEMLFSDRVSLIKIDLETPGKDVVVVDGLSNAVAVDYDFEKKLVVWSDVRNKGIYSANIDGDAKKIIAKDDVVTPDGLAVDWIHGNVYWTDTGKNTISVASMDGEMRKLLFGTDLDEPRAIVVNPLEGWMFWTDWGAQAKIERSGMDGTRRSTIVSKNIAVPNGLAIDFDSRKLFWADVQYHALRSSDYDGSNVKEILYSISRLGHPFAVDVFQDWLYWTDWRSHSVSKVHKITGKNLETVTTKTHLFPMGLRVYHSHKQRRGKKYCGEQNAECPYLCLPTPKRTAVSRDYFDQAYDPKFLNFTCACPDGKLCSGIDVVTMKSAPPLSYSTTGRSNSTTNTFTTTTTTTTTTTSLIATPSQSKPEAYSDNKILHEIRENVYYYGKFAGIIFGMLVVLIIVISLVGFCIYKESLRRSITGLNFVNPVYKKQSEDQAKLESGLDSDPNPTLLV